MEQKTRKVLFTDSVRSSSLLVLTDAPKEAIETWCFNRNLETKEVENTIFDNLKTQYYVKVIVDSDVNGLEMDDIETIGYDETYDISNFALCLDVDALAELHTSVSNLTVLPKRFTYGEFFKFLLENLKEKNLYPEGIIDYTLVSDIMQNELMDTDEFQIVPSTRFGGSEGIYIDLTYDDGAHPLHFATIKTLHSSRDTFYTMTKLGADCYLCGLDIAHSHMLRFRNDYIIVRFYDEKQCAVKGGRTHYHISSTKAQQDAIKEICTILQHNPGRTAHVTDGRQRCSFKLSYNKQTINCVDCDECEHRSEDCLCDISTNEEDCPLTK